MTRANQGSKKHGKGPQKDAAERKRDERAIRNAHRKKKKDESYLADDENFVSFSMQLQTMGLQLRDIPGDGNCLFRALGDQLEGHGKNHLKHRGDVVQYMKDHRDFFEPFMEDNISFQSHLENLGKSGTYAGNDSIVAFARNQGVDVVIHQLNLPVWKVSGADTPNARELHISYHNGDHYSSVRKLADISNNATNFRTKEPYTPFFEQKRKGKHKEEAKPCSYNNASNDEVSDIALFVMQETGCKDLEQIQDALIDNNYDVDATVSYLLQIAALDDRLSLSSTPEEETSQELEGAVGGIWSEEGSGTRIFGFPEEAASKKTEPNRTSQGVGRGRGKPQRVNNRQKKQQQKLEKKQRQMERHKERILGEGQSKEVIDEETAVIVSSEMGALSI